MIALVAPLCASASHPSLPLMWTAKVKEAEVGIVDESYIMVDKPTPDNPSAKWTNFTDGSCQRLIYVPNNYAATRYLLGCDAVDCCTEDQSGNHKEYQIPDVHPAFIAPVTSLGKQQITLFNGSTVEADAWKWRFMVASTIAYTTGTNTLVRWNVTAGGNSFVSDYTDFKQPTTPDEIAAFKAQFQVPAVCRDSRVKSCDGQVSAKSLAFLRAGSERKIYNSATERNTFSTRAVQAAAAHRAPRVKKPELVQPTAIKAGSKTLLFMNDSRVVGTGENSELIALDLATKAMRKISTSIPPLFDYISASVVCGTIYYAVATSAPIAEGLLVVDMATGNATLQPTEGNLFHALACTPTAGKLTVVVSEFTTPRTTFSLREYDTRLQKTARVLYTFPSATEWSGWDSTFSLAKKGELWATFPLGKDIMKIKRGELYIIDTSTGEVKEHKTVGKSDAAGEPYLVLPSDDDTFLWMLAPKGVSHAAEDLKLCTADKSGDELTVKDCKKASEMWSIGSVPAVCGGSVYIGALGFGGPTPIYEVTPSGTFDVINSVDIRSSDYQFGAITCGASM